MKETKSTVFISQFEENGKDLQSLLEDILLRMLKSDSKEKMFDGAKAWEGYACTDRKKTTAGQEYI